MQPNLSMPRPIATLAVSTYDSCPNILPIFPISQPGITLFQATTNKPCHFGILHAGPCDTEFRFSIPVVTPFYLSSTPSSCTVAGCSSRQNKFSFTSQTSEKRFSFLDAKVGVEVLGQSLLPSIKALAPAQTGWNVMDMIKSISMSGR